MSRTVIILSALLGTLIALAAGIVLAVSQLSSGGGGPATGGSAGRAGPALSSQPAPQGMPSPSGGGGGAVTRHTDCVASPHSCGFPDATNTGANCSALAPSGPVTVTSNGAVVEGKNISGSVTVQASDVTIRNDCVTSSDIYPVHFVSGSDLTVEDTTITGTGHGCDRAVERPATAR